MMQRILGLLGLLAASGCLSNCVTDVSKQPPYNQLVGTTWKLKQDAFIVRPYEVGRDYILPCDEKHSSYLPGTIDWHYSEDKFGRKNNERIIKGGLRSGQLLRITRVAKHPNYAMGDQYIPFAMAGDKELSLEHLYEDRTEHSDINSEGKLNPKYAERVK